MNQRPAYEPWKMGARCNECPLFHAGKVPVPPVGPWDAVIAFVGEGPARWEEVKGGTLQGPSGAKLNELLWKVGARREQVFTTNAVMCRCEVPGETGKRRYEVKTYMAWHRKQNVIRRREGLRETVDPFTCCKPRLDMELKILEAAAQQRGAPNGLVVVPLGNFALKQVSEGRVEGKVGGIMKFRGSVLEVKP